MARNDSRPYDMARAQVGPTVQVPPSSPFMLAGETEHSPDRPKRERCQCSDTHCPVHYGREICPHDAAVTLRRVDGFGACRMCQECALDALDSGVYRLQRDNPSP